MSYREEEIITYKTTVICDKCGAEKVLANQSTPLGFDNRMNGALSHGYTFTQEGGVFKNYCFKCDPKRSI